MKPEDRYFPMKINKKGEKTMAKLIINEENKNLEETLQSIVDSLELNSEDTE